jgi:hypothetical protein
MRLAMAQTARGALIQFEPEHSRQQSDPEGEVCLRPLAPGTTLYKERIRMATSKTAASIVGNLTFTQAVTQPILETGYINSSAAVNLTKSSPNWAHDAVHGQTFLSGLTNTAPFEWTQALSPSDEPEVDLIGISGYAMDPHASNSDNPFLHPFCTDPADPGKWDFEFFIAPDPQYQYLAAPPPTTASGISSHSEYTQAVQEAATDFGLHIPDVVGLETDRNLVPPPYRPLQGDRVCVWGRWIVDTGHDDFHTEIHPPLLLVAGRPYAMPGATVQDATQTTIVGRPYLVSQKFSEGGLEAHLLAEVAKVLGFASTKVEAHPAILPKPFDGTFLVSYTIRPPHPRVHAQDVLFVKYNLIVRTGVVVQLVHSGDAVTVYIAMNSNQYVAPKLPTKHNVNITLGELKQLNPTAGDVYEGVIFGSLLVNPLFAPIVLSTGIETDTYDKPLATSPHEKVTRVPVTSLAGNTPMPIDDNQPFPIYGTIALEWERHNLLTGVVSGLHDVLKGI